MKAKLLILFFAILIFQLSSLHAEEIPENYKCTCMGDIPWQHHNLNENLSDMEGCEAKIPACFEENPGKSDCWWIITLCLVYLEQKKCDCMGPYASDYNDYYKDCDKKLPACYEKAEACKDQIASCEQYLLEQHKDPPSKGHCYNYVGGPFGVDRQDCVSDLQDFLDIRKDEEALVKSSTNTQISHCTCDDPARNDDSISDSYTIAPTCSYSYTTQTWGEAGRDLAVSTVLYPEWGIYVYQKDKTLYSQNSRPVVGTPSFCPKCAGDEGTAGSWQVNSQGRPPADKVEGIYYQNSFAECNCPFPLEEMPLRMFAWVHWSHPACYVCEQGSCYQCAIDKNAYFSDPKTGHVQNSPEDKFTFKTRGLHLDLRKQNIIYTDNTWTSKPCNPSGQTSCPLSSSCIGNTNSDNFVDVSDLANILDNWLKENCSKSLNNCCGGADLNGDGAVDFYDYNIITKNWGNDCSGGPPVIDGDL